MQEERIRLGSTDSSNSVNVNNFVDVELQHHTKTFPFPSISETIDQMEVFEQERRESTKYRLILTINPYCSNVLFNAVTEIVQNEGSDKTDELKIIGKETDDAILVNNVDMIRNTKYASDENPFVYHCGFDIFNNHILRNQSFKLVNSVNNYNTDSRYFSNETTFNTIEDFMRDRNGDGIKLYTRKSLDEIVDGNEQVPQYCHLYKKDDILSITDSINANLYENNGWFGFSNRSRIESLDYTDEENHRKWHNMKISKVFNGEHFSCEFIEMYPDSSLYSFTPNYNHYQNREEYNWDICITYPYKNDETKNIVNCGNKNALLIASQKVTVGTSGQDIILFRTLVKHNLKKDDSFKLFYEETVEEVTKLKQVGNKLFKVVNVGNLKGDFTDYYFYINDVNDIKEAFGNSDDKIKNASFRFVRVRNGVDCKYYYRKFKKLPNFRIKKENLDKETASNRYAFDKYVQENCCKDDKMIGFVKEQYPLAFSRTIYNDGNAQVTFTDTIDIENIVDNNGRPLTELFVTIIKCNKGNKLWYKKSKTYVDLCEIEYSHCFSDVTCGIEMHTEEFDDDSVNGVRQKRKDNSDVTTITTRDNFLNENAITIDNDEFYGDLVELEPMTMTETVLSDVCFRFNTEQREHVFNDNDETEINYNNFVYDEILTDDYDKAGFVCANYNGDDINNVNNEKKKTTFRPEGYYHKAHYPVKVREFGNVRQGSHLDLDVLECRPKQAGGMFIEVVTRLRSGVNGGNIVYLCEENSDGTEKKYPLTVNTVLSNVRFLLNPMEYCDDNCQYKDIFEIVKGLLYSEHTITENDVKESYTWVDEDGNENFSVNYPLYKNNTDSGDIISYYELQEKEDDEQVNYTFNDNEKVKDYSKPKYKLRLKNGEIPDYAYEAAPNLYIWRDILNVGDKDAVELKEYPFANGHFYINKEINFFLKRQDPFGHNGLMDKELWPNDIFGFSKKQSNYVYKDQTNAVC